MTKGSEKKGFKHKLVPKSQSGPILKYELAE